MPAGARVLRDGVRDGRRPDAAHTRRHIQGGARVLLRRLRRPGHRVPALVQRHLP